MSGNKIGGLKARDKNLANDPDFYKKNGKLGGAKSRGGGWTGNPEAARIAGARGGRISRRRKPVAEYYTLAADPQVTNG